MMNANRPTDWPIFEASVSLAGLVAQEPLVALAGAVAAWLGYRGSRPVVASSSGLPGVDPTAGRSLNARIQAAFRTSQGSGADSADSQSPATPDEDRAEGSKSYEEFTAGLEEDSEEISFLPPYVSGAPSRADRPGTSRSSSGPDSGSHGSALLNDLEGGQEPGGRMPVSRRFALGTVAIIRHLLEPAEVERILLEQRRYPRLRFGDIAVQLNLLTADDLQELLQAQQDGIFSEEEIADARQRLAAYHRGESA